MHILITIQTYTETFTIKVHTIINTFIFLQEDIWPAAWLWLWFFMVCPLWNVYLDRRVYKLFYHLYWTNRTSHFHFIWVSCCSIIIILDSVWFCFIEQHTHTHKLYQTNHSSWCVISVRFFLNIFFSCSSFFSLSRGLL